MQPEQYEAWYATPRGAWIGEEEYCLLRSLLAPRAVVQGVAPGVDAAAAVSGEAVVEQARQELR